MKTIKIQTNKKNELIDITELIQNEIDVKEGIATVFIPHTTAAVTINENADPDVRSDIIQKLNKLIPEHENYKHTEGNSDAHVKTTLTGSSEQIIINNGRLVLGTWQSIFFTEYDGPRQRKIHIYQK